MLLSAVLNLMLQLPSPTPQVSSPLSCLVFPQSDHQLVYLHICVLSYSSWGQNLYGLIHLYDSIVYYSDMDKWILNVYKKHKEIIKLENLYYG
jgi:hypothetical protein